LDYKLETYLIKNANCIVKIVDFLWSFEPKKKESSEFCKVHNNKKKNCCKQNHKQECMKMKHLMLWKV